MHSSQPGHSAGPDAPATHLYIHRKNLLDVYPVAGRHLGIFREPFERVQALHGLELRPVEAQPECWDFNNPLSGERGRLLSMGAFLSTAPITLNTQGRAYMVTRQDYTLALLFPGAPKRIKLNETRHTILVGSRGSPYPQEWPEGLVQQVIRLRFRTIVILDEVFLLRQIGLRAGL